MDDGEELLKKRLLELDARAAEQGYYCFSEFLSLAEQELLPRSPRSSVTLWGGYEGAERRAARFGPRDGGWEEPFPMVCVKAAPAGGKFAGKLSHRDFLGSLMALGIKRSVVGDIIVSEKTGYILCLQQIAPFIADNLVSVGRESVGCEILPELPAVAAPEPESISVVVASERLDALVGGAYDLSRSAAKEFFDAERVFRNGRLAPAAKDALPGDIISVRGLGRFVYRGVERETKKGRIRAIIEIFR